MSSVGWLYDNHTYLRSYVFFFRKSLSDGYALLPSHSHFRQGKFSHSSLYHENDSSLCCFPFKKGNPTTMFLKLRVITGKSSVVVSKYCCILEFVIVREEQKRELSSRVSVTSIFSLL